MTENTLYYGDNLDVLRRHVKDESVDLVYLDPPFNSAADYNVLFAEHSGEQSASQIQAFEDTWRWDLGAEAAYRAVVEAGGKVSGAMRAMRTLLGESDMMAYLAMMAPRLVELRRVLRPTGSIYLHCDSTASHYLKMLMDGIFGPENFGNEIIWKRSSAHNDARQGARHFGRISDTILFYGKSSDRTWNPQYVPYDREYVERDYRRTDPDGRRYRIDNIQGPGGAAKGNPFYEVMGVSRHWRYSKERMAELISQGRIIQTRPGAVPQYKRYLDEMPGVAVQNIWTDIPLINNRSHEKLGYPTQKPEALLERIIEASSDPGDTVLDPFCGCGTAIAVAQRLKRRWIGIDITHLAITLIKHRLHDATQGKARFSVVGEPVSVPDAEALAASDPYQFQWWALGLVGARPTEQKKGADKGIDGRLFFHDDADGANSKHIVISIKAGHVTVSQVRDLCHVRERERAEIAVLISMDDPTQPMRSEAASVGFYKSPMGKNYPRVQLLTIEEILAGKGIDYPPARYTNVTFKKAPKHAAPAEPDLFAAASAADDDSEPQVDSEEPDEDLKDDAPPPPPKARGRKRT